MSDFHQIAPTIFTVSHFLTTDECQSVIELTESEGYSEAPITTAFGPVQRPDIRNNGRVMWDDPDRAADLWKRAAVFIRPWEKVWQPIGLNERLRFYRYNAGEQFKWHFDGCYERENGERSWFTMLVYLNEDFEGGETAFDEMTVTPKTGMALFFEHQLRHAGLPVIKGCKYVLRSDVMFRFSLN